MSSNEISPRNRAERRMAGKKARAAGAVLTAGSAALAMGAAWVGTGGIPAAGAATFTVTTNADSGAGSLRQAIIDANGAAGADTIDFAPALSGQTITLTSGDIDITDSLTITGPGAAALTIDGNDADRIFYATASLTVSGLTFTNGHSQGLNDQGGAIYAGGSLTVSDAVFSGNTSDDDGGAIFAAGQTSIVNSTFVGNDTNDWGGAVLVFDSAGASVSGSSFQSNTAGDDGGALAIDDVDTFVVTDTVLDQNEAANNGGGLVVYSSAATITGTTFSNNDAGENGGGAHVYEDTTTASITGSTFSGNYAGFYGGGLSLYELDGTPVVDGVTITGNTSSGEGGGGLAARELGGLTVANSNISGNSTDNWGGGIYAGDIYGDLAITNTTIAGNTAGFGGGGVQLWGDRVESGMSVTVTDTTISGNTASDGEGGGWLQWAVTGPTAFNNSTISGNTTNENGGGIYLYNSDTVDINMSTITQNTGGGGTGGVFIQEQNLPAAQGGKVKDKAAKTLEEGRGSDESGAAPTRPAHAAGVSAAATNELNVTGSIIWGNSGNDLGGVGFGTSAHNLLGTVADTLALSDAGGNLTGVDPLLGPLANNGGATQTHELLAGSPAINAGPDPVPAFSGNEFDQRGAGFPRVSGGTSDIGAFEVQPVNIAPRFTG